MASLESNFNKQKTSVVIVIAIIQWILPCVADTELTQQWSWIILLCMTIVGSYVLLISFYLWVMWGKGIKLIAEDQILS